MSSTGIDRFLFGSTTLTAIRRLKWPVIAIPPEKKFGGGIKKIGFACDFKDVAATIPAQLIIDITRAFNAELHVLNVDFKNRQWTNDTPFQSGLVENMFQQYHPQYHFIDKPDMVEGLNEYAGKFSIELLLVIPQKHNIIERIFSGSHTKELVFHSDVPVMVMHE